MVTAIKSFESLIGIDLEPCSRSMLEQLSARSHSSAWYGSLSCG